MLFSRLRDEIDELFSTTEVLTGSLEQLREIAHRQSFRIEQLEEQLRELRESGPPPAEGAEKRSITPTGVAATVAELRETTRAMQARMDEHEHGMRVIYEKLLRLEHHNRARVDGSETP